MAAVVKWKTLSCREQDHLATQATRPNERGVIDKFSFLYNNGCRCFHNSLSVGRGRICNSTHQSSKLVWEPNPRLGVLRVQNADSNGSCNSESVNDSNQISYDARSNDSQLEALESYFSKLNLDNAQQPSSSMSSGRLDSMPRKTRQKDEHSFLKGKKETNQINDYCNSKARLDSLEDYFNKLNSGRDLRSPSIMDDEVDETPKLGIRNFAAGQFNGTNDMTSEKENPKLSGSKDYKRDYSLFDEKSFPDLQTDDEASDFFLINLLAALNIAVLLFEVASPVRDSDPENLSLPLMYGAKINKLILSGEWWRLLTPMCLHSGFLHIALGCWVLLTFGPRVCRAYGQPTFFLMYVLGGICGNLTSFIHTPELTVCGTGPVFALIGAWLVYQSQNKEVISKDVSENLFRQAVIATALSFILSSFGRIDNWTHLGATIAGLIFGYLTCPSVQLDNAAAKDGQKEAVALIQRHANPCKSLAIFTVSIVVLASFAYAYGMQIEMLEPSS